MCGFLASERGPTFTTLLYSMVLNKTFAHKFSQQDKPKTPKGFYKYKYISSLFIYFLRMCVAIILNSRYKLPELSEILVAIVKS